MAKKDFSKRLLISVTGQTDKDWQNKLKEVNKYKLDRVALFLEVFTKRQRREIYKALPNTAIKEIPLVHAKNNMVREEFKFLMKNYGTTHFTIHESTFKIMEKWKGFYRNLYLELNYDNYVPGNVDVNKIGGFCVDLSHFKVDEELWSIKDQLKFRKYLIEILNNL